MSDEACGAAAAHIALAALGSSSALLFSIYICYSRTAHAALVAHRLDGKNDAAMGLCIIVLGDLR